jgi:hypothetical protein
VVIYYGLSGAYGSYLDVVHFGCPVFLSYGFLMDYNRNWNCLAWNVRGVNSQSKWDAIRNKVGEHKCNIVCLQETKHKHFDQSYVRKFLSQKFECL